MKSLIKKSAPFNFFSSSYKYINEQGVIVEQIETDEGYKEQHIYPDSLLSDVFIFYPNSTLKCKYKVFTKGGFVVGRVVHYNDSGKIYLIEDSDKPYPFSLENALVFLKDSNINIDDSTYHTSINRMYVPLVDKTLIKKQVDAASSQAEEELPPPPDPNLEGLEGLYVWHIKLYIPQYREEDIYLDATTGKVLKEAHKGEPGSFYKSY